MIRASVKTLEFPCLSTKVTQHIVARYRFDVLERDSNLARSHLCRNESGLGNWCRAVFVFRTHPAAIWAVQVVEPEFIVRNNDGELDAVNANHWIIPIALDRYLPEFHTLPIKM